MKKAPPQPIFPRSDFRQVYDKEIQELIFLLKITVCFLAGFAGMVFAEMLL